MNWRDWLRKHSSDWMKKYNPLLSTLLFAVAAGTYLDLYFVGKGLYAFPLRPWPDIFSVNIAFTLAGLPLGTALFLAASGRSKPAVQAVLIFLAGLFMAVLEKQAEVWGFFVHSPAWKHIYSFFGYSIYLATVTAFYNWQLQTQRKKS